MLHQRRRAATISQPSSLLFTNCLRVTLVSSLPLLTKSTDAGLALVTVIERCSKIKNSLYLEEKNLRISRLFAKFGC